MSELSECRLSAPDARPDRGKADAGVECPAAKPDSEDDRGGMKKSKKILKSSSILLRSVLY